MAEQYDVEARIHVEKGGASTAVDGLSRKVLGLGRSGGIAGGMISRAVTAAVGFAGAYFGVRAMVGGFQSLVVNAGKLSGQLQVTRTSLGAILAATQPALAGIADTTTRLNQAGAAGDAIFRQLQDDAIRSVATSAQLANIYAGIAGPLLGAGAALSTVRKITNDTVAASTALGVDFEQAQRDIMMMAEGVAGTDVKLFRMLRSVGLITETTEEWNQLLPEDRVKRIGEALSTFGPSAARFGKTLPGAVSTFTDVMQQFRGAFMGPTLQRFTAFLSRFNDLLITSKDQIKAFLGVAGDRMGAVFGRLFDRVGELTAYLINNMESVITSLGTKIDGLRQTFAPVLELMSKVTPTGVLAGAAAGKGLGMIGGVGGIVELGNKIGLGQGRNALGQFTPNRIAGGAGGLAILGVAAGTVSFIVDVWESLVAAFNAFLPILQIGISGVMALVNGLGNFLWPAFKLIGAVVTGVVTAAFMGLSAILAFFGPLLKYVGTFFNWAGKQLQISLKWITEGFQSLIQDIIDGLKILGLADDVPVSLKGRTQAAADAPGFFDKFMLDMKAALGAAADQKEDDKKRLAALESKGAPQARARTVNDMRGSTINVKQDFKEADPDRVWLQMLDGINAAADKRLASALVPDFTR